MEDGKIEDRKCSGCVNQGFYEDRGRMAHVFYCRKGHYEWIDYEGSTALEVVHGKSFGIGEELPCAGTDDYTPGKSDWDRASDAELEHMSRMREFLR